MIIAAKSASCDDRTILRHDSLVDPFWNMLRRHREEI
jgi:hypothetical protein